jgi:hypothetical protein
MTSKHGLAVLAHAGEVVGRGVRDALVFLCFLVVGMVPPMLLFLHTMLSTYIMVLAHLHPNALLALAIFHHFYEAYIGVRLLVALFRVFFEARLDASLTFRLRPSMVMRFIPMLHRDWEEWRVNWCFVRFSEKDDPMEYAEPTGAPEALPIWTSPASTTGLEAVVERIQNLWTSTSLPTTW